MMLYFLILGLIGRFQISDSCFEDVSLYESRPSFLWEDSCSHIVDACISSDRLLLLYNKAPFSEYSGISCYSLSDGILQWELDSLKTEKYPIYATVDRGRMYVQAHHPDSLTQRESSEFFDWHYNFSQRAEHAGSSQYLLRCYDIVSGELISEFPSGALPALAPPLIVDDRIVLLCPNQICCFNSTDVEQQWALELNKPPIHVAGYYAVDTRAERYSGGVLLHEGVLYIGLKYPKRSSGNDDLMNLFAVSFDSGRILWKAFQESGVYRGPDVHENALFIYSYATVCKLNMNSGEMIWEREYGEGRSTNLWQHPALWIIHAEGRPLAFYHDWMLIPCDGGGFSDSLDFVGIENGFSDHSLPVAQMYRGIHMLDEEESGNQFLLSTQNIDRDSYLSLRNLPEGEILWKYRLNSIRSVSGEGYVCALNRSSFMVFR